MAEHGAQRNFEPWREDEAKKNAGSDDSEDDVDRLMATERAELEDQEEDSMRSLEKNQIESKREMEILDKLQEIRSRNARMERSANGRSILTSVSSRVDSNLAGVKEVEEEERRLKELEEDEAEVARFFSKVTHPPSTQPVLDDSQPVASGSGSKSHVADDEDSEQPPLDDGPSSTFTIKRKFTDAEPDLRSLLSDSSREMLSSTSFTKAPPKKKKSNLASQFGIKVVKKTASSK